MKGSDATTNTQWTAESFVDVGLKEKTSNKTWNNPLVHQTNSSQRAEPAIVRLVLGAMFGDGSDSASGMLVGTTTRNETN